MVSIGSLQRPCFAFVGFVCMAHAHELAEPLCLLEDGIFGEAAAGMC